MRVTVPGAPRKIAARPAPVGPGRLRKVGIIGGAPNSLRFAPWNDPSWEFWGHSSVVLQVPYLRCDRLFDLHPKHCFMEARKNGFKDYFAFLKTCPTPVYMQSKFEDVPMSVRYPLEQVQMQWPGVPLGSQTAYMIALALMEGVTHLGFWGVDYAHETEYQKQRSNAEFWAGMARGMGVQLVLPQITPFCQEPRELYAYESHATPEKYAAIKAEFKKVKESKRPGLPFKADKLVILTPEREAEAQALREQHQPQWVKEVAKMGDEQIPQDILDKEAREAGATREQRRIRAAEIKAALARHEDVPVLLEQ